MKEGEGTAAAAAYDMCEFVEAVRHMRLAQRVHDKTRAPDAFTCKMKAQAAVDAYLRPVPKADNKQPDMFD